MSSDAKQGLAQSIYDKIVQIEALTEQALALCTDIREGDPIPDTEDKKSPDALMSLLLRIETGLEAASDELPTMKNRLVTDFSALPSAPLVIPSLTTTKLHPPPNSTDTTDTVISAFKQLNLDGRSEMLKHLIDCQREPARGEDPVEVVVRGFRALEGEGRRELLKRLIDC